MRVPKPDLKTTIRVALKGTARTLCSECREDEHGVSKGEPCAMCVGYATYIHRSFIEQMAKHNRELSMGDLSDIVRHSFLDA